MSLETESVQVPASASLGQLTRIAEKRWPGLNTNDVTVVVDRQQDTGATKMFLVYVVPSAPGGLEGG